MASVAKGGQPALSGDILTSAGEATLAARQVFYDALADVAPSELRQLAAAGRKALTGTDRTRFAWTDAAAWRETVPLGPCVVAWAHRHRLDTVWLIDDAIWALLEWGNHAESPTTELRLAPRFTPGTTSAAMIAGFGRVEEMAFAWELASVPRVDFKRIMLATLEQRLDEALDSIEAQAKAAGAGTYDKREIARHMRWVVWRVVHRQSPQKIASHDNEECKPRAIGVAIQRASDLIGLPVPPLPRGRQRNAPARVRISSI